MPPRAAIDPTDGLTIKQRAFVAGYVANAGNSRAAARAAGYTDPKSAADDNRTKPAVQAALAQYHAALTAAAKLSDITPTAIVRQLWSIAQRACADNPPRYGEATRALEVIARHLGMFVDRVQLESVSYSIRIVRDETGRPRLDAVPPVVIDGQATSAPGPAVEPDGPP